MQKSEQPAQKAKPKLIGPALGFTAVTKKKKKTKTPAAQTQETAPKEKKRRKPKR